MALLRYEPLTGKFYWREDRGRARAGSEAGCDYSSFGHIRIKIDGSGYMAHRLAWRYMTGEDPGSHIDHRDTNPANNRWANLRRATRSQNIANSRRRKDNTSGSKGVYLKASSGKWAAACAGKHVGYYGNIDDARHAYAHAAEQKYGDYSRVAG